MIKVTKQEFNEFLNSILEEEDKRKFKKESKTNVAKFFFGFSFLGLMSVIVFVIIGAINKDIFLKLPLIFIIAFITFVLFIIGMLIKYKSVGVILELENKYKQPIVDFLLKNINYHYSPKTYISHMKLLDSQFIREYPDKYSGEDELEINILNDDNTPSNNYLKLSDVRAIKVVRNEDGEERNIQLYSGVFGYIDFPFYFKSTLTINSVYKARKPLQKVKLEDIKFNKAFKITCDDQIEARYILTPEIMQDLLELKKRMGQVKIVLDSNHMYIGFPNKNLFSMNKFAKTINETNFYSFCLDVDTILSLTTAIQKNNKIFKI